MHSIPHVIVWLSLCKTFPNKQYKKKGPKNKKQNTGQVRTLKEGSWFQIKSKSSVLQAGLCMMAHGSGQCSETERLWTGLDFCLCRAEPQTQGPQNTPLKSQIIVQSLTSSRVYSLDNRSKTGQCTCTQFMCYCNTTHLHCFQLRKEVIRINESFKSWHSGCFPSGNIMLIYMYVIYTYTEILCYSTLDS